MSDPTLDRADLATGAWIFRCLIGWQWGIWYGDEEFPRKSGWCLTRKAARKKAGLPDFGIEGEY